MTDKVVLLETEGAIARVTLNNPPVNAVSIRLLDALHAALDEVERNKTIRCVILTGAGEKAFCAGADLRQESSMSTPADGKAFRDYGRRTLQRILNKRAPKE